MAEEAAKPAEYIIEADGSRLRTLLKPVEAPAGQVTKIRVRTPKYAEIMLHGDPAALILMDRSALPYEDMSIVRGYVNALIQTEDRQVLDPAVLEQCDYRDAIALKNMVMSFFK